MRVRFPFFMIRLEFTLPAAWRIGRFRALLAQAIKPYRPGPPVVSGNRFSGNSVWRHSGQNNRAGIVRRASLFYSMIFSTFLRTSTCIQLLYVRDERRACLRIHRHQLKLYASLVGTNRITTHLVFHRLTQQPVLKPISRWPPRILQKAAKCFPYLSRRTYASGLAQNVCSSTSQIHSSWAHHSINNHAGFHTERLLLNEKQAELVFLVSSTTTIVYCALFFRALGILWCICWRIISRRNESYRKGALEVFLTGPAHAFRVQRTAIAFMNRQQQQQQQAAATEPAAVASAGARIFRAFVP